MTRTGSWRARVAALLALALVALAVPPQAPALAAEVTLTVESWQHDLPTNAYTYQVSVDGTAGSECFSSLCSWVVQGGALGWAARDGLTVTHLTINGQLP